MQIEPPKEKKLVKLERLADEINSKHAEAIKFARESYHSGRSAVVAAAQCGALLSIAKKSAKGKYLKWLADNCPEISEDTAERWRKLADSAHMRNLDEFTGLRQAYLACGIISEPEKAKPKPIGTAEVDMFQTFVSQIVRECDRICALVDGVEVTTIPDEGKDMIRSAIARVKEMEAKL